MKKYLTQIKTREWAASELAIRKLSKKAQKWYDGQDPFKIAEIDDINGNKVYLFFERGCLKYLHKCNNLDELNSLLEAYADTYEEVDEVPWYE